MDARADLLRIFSIELELAQPYYEFEMAAAALAPQWESIKTIFSSIAKKVARDLSAINKKKTMDDQTLLVTAHQFTAELIYADKKLQQKLTSLCNEMRIWLETSLSPYFDITPPRRKQNASFYLAYPVSFQR